jgi:prepilin-type N-terminal cleavage/methylation domain-containing protein
MSRRRAGLTLIELLLAVGLLAVVSTVAFLCYDSAVRAWRAGTELSNSLHQGDYVLEQLVMGLRSAYWRAPAHGFQLYDDGASGAAARDAISWVKFGSALIGAETPYAGMPHAVEVAVRDVPDGRGGTRSGLTVRSWRLDLQKEDFKPDQDVPPVLLSTRVVGFNCRVLDPNQPPPVADQKPELKWTDEWTGSNTNHLPYAVELTLYVQPPEEGQEPVEIKRIVRIPMAERSWNK